MYKNILSRKSQRSTVLVICGRFGRIVPMTVLANILPWIQIILSILLIIGILFQNGGAGLEGALGGGDTGTEGPGHTRRGAERGLFRLTIIFAVLFTISAIASLFIR